MSNVLILSASTGQGHNQAANSLKNELEASGYKVTVSEPIKEEGRFINVMVQNGYSILATRLPKMYGKLYKITDHHSLINKGCSTILNISLGNTLLHLIDLYKPDLLVSTHPLLVNVVSYLKSAHRVNFPFIAVVTDYMAHRFYVNKCVDAYIVGSEYTKNTLIAKGVEEHKIFPYGIPIRKEFRQPRRKKNNTLFTILLMGGSMGISLMKKCLEQLVENRHKFRLVVVCGHNEKLKNELEEKYPVRYKEKEIKIYGFTTNIPELMDESDVIVTKPGGLTVSEAINKNIPIIIPFYLPGQEEENAEILVKAGVAANVSNLSELNRVINNFCENPELLEKMRLREQEISQEFSPASVVALADKLIFNSTSLAKRDMHA